jgi:hypothetical protein
VLFVWGELTSFLAFCSLAALYFFFFTLCFFILKEEIATAEMGITQFSSDNYIIAPLQTFVLFVVCVHAGSFISIGH